MARIKAGDDLYADAGMSEKAPMSENREESSSPTAVLPKEILMGKTFEPGDSVILRIEEIGDDSIVVSYDTSAKGSEEEGEGGEESSYGRAPMPSNMSDLMG